METIKFETETQLAKIETTQLDEVVKNSGLAVQESEEIKKSYLPFLQQLTDVQSQAVKINYKAPTVLDEKIARELRLATVKIRTGAAALKDERKRTYLLRGNLEQSAYNLIKDSCAVIEDEFTKVEKAREIAEKKRKDDRKLERIELLAPYGVDITFIDLLNMPDDSFMSFLESTKDAFNKKIESEKKAEEERIAKEKAEEAERQRIRIENIRLQKEAEEREKQIEAEREKARAEAEEKERLSEIERKKQADILRAEQEKAAKEKAELLAKAEKELKEKQRLEKEIADKKAEEEKIRKETEAKIEADKRARAIAEKKAKLAPDKIKILEFGQALNDVPRPQIKSIEAIEIMATINGLLVKLNNYIIENANKL